MNNTYEVTDTYKWREIGDLLGTKEQKLIFSCQKLGEA